MSDLTNGQMINCAQKNLNVIDNVKDLVEELYALDLEYQTSRDEIVAYLETLHTETVKKLYDAEIVRYTQLRNALPD